MVTVPTSTSCRRSRRQPERIPSREAILRAAEALLLEAGAEGISIRSVSDRCGYKAPTIYYYFGDKPGLIRAVLEVRFRELLESLRAVPAQKDAAAYLRALAYAFVRFGLDHPVHYRLLSMGRLAGSELPPSAQAAWDLVAVPVGTLARGDALGATDEEAAILSTWAMLHGLIILAIEANGTGVDAQVVETALDSIDYGLWRRGASAR